MNKEEIFNAPKYAGIYYFKNEINGKYYIGQAVKLRKRLLHHMNNYLNDRYDVPIYRAFRKYGLDNFSWGILTTIRDALNPATKYKLDELEKRYIQEYNSYGQTGYNATLGGDAGVLGLRHTKESKDKIKQAVDDTQKEKEGNPENWIKAKDLLTGSTVISIGRKYLAAQIGVSVSALGRALLNGTVLKKRWIISRYMEEFPQKSVTDLPIDTEQTILDILQQNPNIRPKDVTGINKSTFLWYRRKLGKVPEHRTDTKVSKQDFIDYYSNHSREETINHFNISSRRFYKYRQKYLNNEDRQVTKNDVSSIVNARNY